LMPWVPRHRGYEALERGLDRRVTSQRRLHLIVDRSLMEKRAEPRSSYCKVLLRGLARRATHSHLRVRSVLHSTWTRHVADAMRGREPTPSPRARGPWPPSSAAISA